MRRSLALALSLAPTTALAAQNPRPPQTIETSPLGLTARVATAGDLSAILTESGAMQLELRTSDGRGVEWSAPVPIDALPGLPEQLSSDGLAIVGDRIYVSYSDERHGTREVFVRSYDVTSGTLSPEVRVPNGYPAGEAETFGWQLAAEAAPGGDRVYLVLAVDVPSPNIERARFVASHDGGLTFPIERQLTPGTADLDAAYQLEAAGGVVHVAWSDSRYAASGNDVFYQRSTDGGLTFLPADVELDATGPGVGSVTGVGFHMIAAPPLLVLGWSEYVGSILEPRIHGIVSLDQGLTFGPDQEIDQAPVGSLSAITTVAVTADPDSGGAAVAWHDTRDGHLGKAEVYVASTLDGGLNWNETKVSSGGVLGPFPEDGSVLAADGRTSMAFTYAGYYTGEIFSALSLDGGATWEPPVSIAEPPLAGSGAWGSFATNALYGNRIHVWSDGVLFSTNLVVGGYRVPTLDLVQGGGGFHFELSEMGSSPFGAVLLSSSPGSLPVGFGDPRDLGLAPDALFVWSLGQAGGTLGAPLVAGAGATPFVAAPIPPGLGIHAAAVSFDLSGGVTIGEITDVQLLP